MKLPRALYITLIVLCTDLILVAPAALILWPMGMLDSPLAGVLGFVLAWKVLISSILLIITAKWFWSDQLVGFGGYYTGRFLGLLSGGLIGAKYESAIAAIVLAVVLYLVVGRMGRKISLVLHEQGKRLGLAPSAPAIVTPPVFPGWFALLPYAYSVGVPMVVALLALAFDQWGINDGATGAQYLPVARLVVIAYSLFGVLALWIWWRGAAKQLQLDATRRRRSLLILGVLPSTVLAIGGLVLLLGFGASFIEVLAFAMVSAIGGVGWVMRMNRLSPQDAARRSGHPLHLH